MEQDPMRGFREKETISLPTVEKLAEQEKGLGECFAEATLPVLLWLNRFRMGDNYPAPGDLKEYLQSQNLPTIPELRKTDPSAWEGLYDEKIQVFRRKADKPTTIQQKEALDKAIEDRRVMSGMQAPKNQHQQLLPQYFVTEATGRDFCFHREKGERVLSVPDPRPFAYRINIPDAPGELREVVLSRVAQKFWEHPLFKQHGFQAKIIGFAKTDGLIFYMCDAVVNEGLSILHEDALEHGYGLGEPARFGQVIDSRIPGMTITTNPRDEQGETAGTFGDVVSKLLADSLAEALEKSGISPENLIQRLLRHDAGEWASTVLEPVFTKRSKEKFGKRVNMHNLAFIDKG